MPPALAKRPVDRRGFPIGFTAGEGPDGELMQGTNDGNKVLRCIMERLCGLCGQPLGYWIAFLGDDETVRRREFMEPPLHVDCARYALAVCPYLAAPSYTGKRQREGVQAVASRERPERMALYITRGYKPLLLDLPMTNPNPPRFLEWC